MQFGYYGKTVHRGDFVKFNLPQTFINVWDDWLQQVLHVGEIRHAEEWSAVYNNCATYRFGLSCGVAGETTWIGVMRPATDKVGRQFPFCIALSLPANISPIAHVMALEPVYAEIQKLIGQVVLPDYDFDSLQNTMADISLAFIPGLETLSHSLANNFIPSDPISNLSIRTNSSSVLHHPTHLSSLLDSLLRQTWFSYSVWQAVESPDETQTSLISCGLPITASALALFDGAWDSSKTGNLELSNNQSDLTTLSQLTVDPSDHFPASELANELATESTDNITSIDADSTQTGPERMLNETELTPDSDDISMEFEKPKKIIPSVSESNVDAPPADQDDDAAPSEALSSEALPSETLSSEERVDPVVERLELDEEIADDNPWDKN